MRATETVHRPARPPRAHRRAERGAALMVAMIMIFMLSLLGVSAMQSSALEQQMAVNSILANDVLQAAESANESILNDWTNLSRANASADNAVTFDAPLGAESLFDSQVRLVYVGDGNAIGGSLDASQGATSLDELRYEARGTASVPDVRARREVRQGAYRRAPK